MVKDFGEKSKILNIPYPVVGLSPMDGITDNPYREITKKYGNPDIMFTEFTHVMGLCYAAQNILKDFEYTEGQRPIVAQIYGAEPEYFYHAAKIVCALGFDGVDINMGCPARNVSSSGAGAGLIRTPDLAREIIVQVYKGVADWVADGKLTGLKPKARKAVEEMRNRYQLRITSSEITREEMSNGQKNLLSGSSQLEARSLIPVSVKTRIGYDVPVTESWIKNIAKENPQWITVHGRTLKQMYTGEASWDQIKIAVESTDIPVMANGDVKERKDVKRILDTTGAKGVLVGRASYGNPAIFADPQKWKSELLNSKFEINPILQNSNLPTTTNLLLTIMLEHAKFFDDFNSNSDKAFVQMRKHFAWYIQTITKNVESTSENVEFFVKMKELKLKLIQSNSYNEVEELLNSIN